MQAFVDVALSHAEKLLDKIFQINTQQVLKKNEGTDYLPSKEIGTEKRKPKYKYIKEPELQREHL